MTGSRMAMSSDFLAAFAKLPSQQQRLVRAMIARFERDSRASGLNYEKIAGAKDPNMRSLRIDGGYRAVVLKPAEGNVHILLWADKHDDAYQWATRHACSINAETGALQVYQPQQAAEETEEAAETPPTDTPGIFGQLKHRELLRLGVPAAMAAEVLEIRDEAALEEMASRLPVEAYEALFLYMAGETYEQIILERETPPEPVDTTDFATALRRDETRSRFVVIDDDRELEEMFSAPWSGGAYFCTPRSVAWSNATGTDRCGCSVAPAPARPSSPCTAPAGWPGTCRKVNESCSRPSPATLWRTSRTTCKPSVRRRR